MDTATLNALRNRHPAACGATVREYTPILLRLAERVLRQREEAEDVVQETFVKAFARLDSLECAERFGPWLKRIALNQAISRYRGRKRRKEHSIESLLPRFDDNETRMDWPDETTANAEASLESASVRVSVRAAIDRLPESHRIVIVLRDIEELSTREAADLLGIEENALKVRLHRARAALRTLLEPVWREAVA